MPPLRLAKAHRAYAMEYVRSMWPETIQLFGAETARFLAGGGARLVGLQLFQQLAAVLGADDGFGPFLVRLAEAQGDSAGYADGVFDKGSWRLMDGVEAHPMLVEIWTCLLQGMAAAYDRNLTVTRTGALEQGGFLSPGLPFGETVRVSLRSDLPLAQAKTKTAAEAGADVAKDFEAAGNEEKKPAQ